MTAERDELAQDIDHVLYTDSFYGDMFRDGHGRKTLIDAILAAGYRKPRVVETVEELDALPEGSVILSNDGEDSAQKDDTGYWYLWGGDIGLVSAEIMLPVTVLHEGGVK